MGSVPVWHFLVPLGQKTVFCSTKQSLDYMHYSINMWKMSDLASGVIFELWSIFYFFLQYITYDQFIWSLLCPYVGTHWKSHDSPSLNEKQQRGCQLTGSAGSNVRAGNAVVRMWPLAGTLETQTVRVCWPSDLDKQSSFLSRNILFYPLLLIWQTHSHTLKHTHVFSFEFLWIC